MVWDNWWFFFG